METTMRYVQKRVESFVLRTTNGASQGHWRDQNTTADPVECVITNLSLDGGAILLPKNLVLSSNELRLRIPSPRETDIGDVSITARVRWTDAYYSISRKKIGLQFMKYGDSDKPMLRKLIEWFADSEHTTLPCSLQL